MQSSQKHVSRRKPRTIAPWSVVLICLVLVVKTKEASAFHQFAHTISGIVFNDYNQNGSQDPGKPGIAGIKVLAYDAADNLEASTITDASGAYTLDVHAGPARVQFNGFGSSAAITHLAAFYPSVPDRANDTPVTFVSGTQAHTTVNLGLGDPSDYCQQNPNVVTNCYITGDQSSPNPVLVRFPPIATGDKRDPLEKGLAAANQAGPTFGLAYRRSSDSLFAAAFMKRHAYFAPGGGPGAIYLINQARSNTPVARVTPFVVLPTGPDRHDHADPTVDGSAYDAVGKTSLGGLALSDDEATLYAMNLFDKSLYAIPLGVSPSAPVAGSPAAFVVPMPGDCPDADTNFRPFAVTNYEGLIYVGAVCSAETTQQKNDLHGYLFQFDPNSKHFQQAPIFEFGLNYPRQCSVAVYDSPATPCIKQFPAAWNPWSSSYHPYQTNRQQTWQTATAYPQPLLSSVAFDNGNLILGLRDRFGDQGGPYNPAPDGSARYLTTTAGDLLRACLKTPGDLTAGWVLEHSGNCGNITTKGAHNGKGPGNGQYYFQENYRNIHGYVSDGGVLQLPGSTSVLDTALDPTDNIFSGGTHATSNVTGALTSSYQVYGPNAAGTFSKANGLGSLVALCEAAPLEIGHRVWRDTNGNGLQDADEPGIAGVTVHLYATSDAGGHAAMRAEADRHGNPMGARLLFQDVHSSETLVATTTTDANGDYSFAVKPYTQYVIKLDNATDYAAGHPLAGLQLTKNNQDGQHQIDSRALLSSAGLPIGIDNFPVIPVAAHTPGHNDYTFSLGFTAAQPTSVPTNTPTIPATPTTLPTATAKPTMPPTITMAPTAPATVAPTTTTAPTAPATVAPTALPTAPVATVPPATATPAPVKPTAVPTVIPPVTPTIAPVPTPTPPLIPTATVPPITPIVPPTPVVPPTPTRPVATPTPLVTPTPTLTLTPTVSATATATPILTPTPTPTATATPTPIPTPTATATPIPTVTPTLIVPTATPVPTPTPTVRPTPTIVPSPVPTVTPSPTLLPTATVIKAPLPTVTLTATPTPPSSTVKVWVQTLDVCREALPGAIFVLQGHGLSLTRQAADPDSEPVPISTAGPCPLSHGNCVTVSAGCVSWDLPVPAMGMEIYTVTEVLPPAGYVSCLNSTGCGEAPGEVMLAVDSTGRVSAITQELVYNGSVLYPLDGGSFSATQADPALIYNSKPWFGYDPYLRK